MKIFVALLAVLALVSSAPEPRHLFHEHYEEFLDVIAEEAGEELDRLIETYFQFEEFLAGVEYLFSPRFRNLVYEMEDLPEFKAVVDFLESHNIDILYFVNEVNEAIDNIYEYQNNEWKDLRQAVSGRDMSAFVLDSVQLFPRDKLTALYDEKMANSESFRLAMEDFRSEEWAQIWDALWENEVFLTEVRELGENGIDARALLVRLKAVLGIFD